MVHLRFWVPFLLALTASVPRPAAACTNFLITRGASADGSTMITYAADSHELYGELYYLPAGRHAAGEMRDIIEWDTGKLLGRIKEAPVTYAVVGNMNEHQVAIGETTFGGREELFHGAGVLDYGSLIYVALQRARTAREAIRIMGELTAEYGYVSEGESFSIGDPREVWIMDMVGKGKGQKGALWVARRVPDGYVSGHANQPRIRQFPRHDPQSCLYAPDVVSFARQKGWYKGRDEAFSFADTYAPPTFAIVRGCDARVWSMFRRVAQSSQRYLKYAMGVEGAEPLPLWIKPDRKLSVHDVMELMRDHFEGTPMDLTKGVGAGPYQLPYRWRPLTFKVDGVKYLNERSTATQQTGFSFVAQMRSWLPSAIGGVLWFGVDDTASTVYVPMYCGIREVPRPFAVGNGDFRTFSWDSAFWVFNFVANYSYQRYRDMIQDVRKVQAELEGGFLARQSEIDETALKLYRTGPDLARAYLTEYVAKQSQNVLSRWRKLGEALIVKYLDGNVRDATGKVTHPGYPEEWYRRVARESGDACRLRRFKNEPPEKQPPTPNGMDAHGPAPAGAVRPAAPTRPGTPAPAAPRTPAPRP